MIQIFSNDYDKESFYALMGCFFAEKSYKKLLPYLVNTENLTWYINTNNKAVRAFSSVEEQHSKINFKDDFFVKDIKYLEEILIMKLNSIDGIDKPIETATNNQEILKLYERYGFCEYKRTTNYVFLRKEVTNVKA